jgi:hypothetical protein
MVIGMRLVPTGSFVPGMVRQSSHPSPLENVPLVSPTTQHVRSS